jgi:hypothetical protein
MKNLHANVMFGLGNEGTNVCDSSVGYGRSKMPSQILFIISVGHDMPNSPIRIVPFDLDARLQIIFPCPKCLLMLYFLLVQNPH